MTPGGVQSNEVRSGAAASANATSAALRALVALICITMKDSRSGEPRPAEVTAGHALKMLQDLQRDAAVSKTEGSRQQTEAPAKSKHSHSFDSCQCK